MKFKHIPTFAALLSATAILLQTTSCGFIIVNDMTPGEADTGADAGVSSAVTESFTAEEYVPYVPTDHYATSRL